MPNNQPLTFSTISQYHAFRGLPKPQHPLVSIVNFEDVALRGASEPNKIVTGFYNIALKRATGAKMKYGQQQYDFDEGVMLFMAPGQVFAIEAGPDVVHKGYGLFIHPDFLWGTALASKIKEYGYFDYSVHEALFLSDREEAAIIAIMQNIQQEYDTAIDAYSHSVIIAQIELLLTYCERFYNRQFITRRVTAHNTVSRLESLLIACFTDEALQQNGLPTVQYVAGSLALSPNYLSSLLKTVTGQSTQQHIHNKLIEKAKEKLSVTNLSVSEIAFALGFEHSQSFSKLFRVKTGVSPLDFRQSFN